MRYLFLSLIFISTMVQEGASLVCHKPIKVQVPGPKKEIDPKEAHCLATTIYGEARGESEIGQVAMAYTVLNRAIKQTVCRVVLAPHQYSIFNDNPALRAAALSPHLEPKHKNIIDKKSWEQAKYIASVVMVGSVPDPTKGSTHYLSDRVMMQKGYRYPRWSKEYVQVAIIGGHRFFKQNIKI